MLFSLDNLIAKTYPYSSSFYSWRNKDIEFKDLVDKKKYSIGEDCNISFKIKEEHKDYMYHSNYDIPNIHIHEDNFYYHAWIPIVPFCNDIIYNIQSNCETKINIGLFESEDPKDKIYIIQNCPFSTIKIILTFPKDKTPESLVYTYDSIVLSGIDKRKLFVNTVVTNSHIYAGGLINTLR